MLLTLAKSKQQLLIATFLLLLASCKQSEFYDKAALLDAGKAPSSGVETGTTADPTTPSTTTTNDPSVPLVVVADPAPVNPPVVVVTPPTVTPPVVTNPPVVNPPVVTTPPVVNPPVVTTPPVIVAPPVVITPPVITEPPIVIVPPIINPPVVVIPPIAPPVVVNPPVITPPIIVVTPPVIVEPPVVVTPPVVTPPPVVVTPPVVTPPPVVVTPPVIVTPPVVVVPPTPTPTPTPIINLSDRKEFFTQNSYKEGDVDVLWMIDNSGSMANKQASLSASLGIFIDKFLDKDINFKMAIITSDGTSSYNGKMIGDASKLTSAYLKSVGKAKFMSYFQSIVKVGTNGSGTEQGLKTSATFFDRYAASFLRAEANLAIVEISDENDQSEQKDVNYYLNKFYALKSSKGMIKVYSIVTKVLPDDHSLQDSIGTRYVQASTATGGTSSDIKNNFSSMLLDIGTSIVTLVDSFALADAPYKNIMKVYVNKVQVTSGWTYDATSHAIKFNASSIPAEGAQVEVDYQVESPLKVLGAI